MREVGEHGQRDFAVLREQRAERFDVSTLGDGHCHTDPSFQRRRHPSPPGELVFTLRSSNVHPQAKNITGRLQSSHTESVWHKPRIREN
jgi:hypothetical protein